MTSNTFPRPAAVRSRLAAWAVTASATAVALAALGSLPVMAQPAPPAPASGMAPAADAPAATAAGHTAAGRGQVHLQPQQQPQTREQRMERWQQRRAERMAAFKAQLQLTPAQEQAWTDFTAALQPEGGQRHARLDRDGMDQLTTPERIDRMRAVRIQRAAEADRRGEAVKAFYAALSAPQQDTFDARMQQQMQQRQQMHEGRMHPGMSDRHGGQQHRQRTQRSSEGQGKNKGKDAQGAMHHRHGHGHSHGHGHGHNPAWSSSQGGMQRPAMPAPAQPGSLPGASSAAQPAQ